MVGPACRFTVPLREDEAQRGKRLPEDTGSWREPMAMHDSITTTFPGILTWCHEGGDHGQSQNPRPAASAPMSAAGPGEDPVGTQSVPSR